MPRPPYQHGRPGPGLGYVSEVEKSLASESLLLYVGDATPRQPKHSHLLHNHALQLSTGTGGLDTGSSRLAQVEEITLRDTYQQQYILAVHPIYTLCNPLITL